MNLSAARTSLITFLFLLFLSFNGKGQDLYKTPSGEKYHLSSCRMVVNVSKKLVDGDDIAKYHLQPCKICSPPVRQSLVNNYSEKSKAAGESNSIQCQGNTKAGTRCMHKTSIANGYCYQHTDQYKAESINNNLKITQPVNSSICGAKTKSGGHCQRKVGNGGHCYQHQ